MLLKKSKFLYMAPLFVAAAFFSSCSTTRTLGPDELRLASNEISILNDKDFQASALTPYIKQQPNSSFLGIKLPLYIYNLSDGSDKGLNKFWKKLGEAPVVYEQNLTELSKKSIENRLAYMGYFDSTVEAELRIKGKNARVHYYVTLGKRYPISEINFKLPASRKDFETDFLADSLSLSIHKGDFLSEQALSAEVDRSLSALREKGYYALGKSSYSFVADTLAGDGCAKLEYRIEEVDSPLYKVKYNKVNIIYPEDLEIKESVLEGVNLIRPGQEYQESVVSNTYSRFSALKIFRTVGIDLKQSSPKEVDCDINLTKSAPQGFKTNLEVSSNSSGLVGISPQINVYHKNLFGGGEWLNVGFVGNFQFRLDNSISSNELGASLSLSLPKFLGLDYKYFTGPVVPRTEFNLSFNYQNRPEYTRNIFSTSFGYSGVIKERFYYQLYPLQINYVRLFDLNADFLKGLERNPFMRYAYQDHCDFGAGGSLYYNSSTDIIPKTSYNSLRFTLDVSGNLLSLFRFMMKSADNGEKLVFGAPYSQYARTELILAKGIRLKDDASSLAFRLLAGMGFAYGNSTVMPYEKQFYSGGSSSMRGWQARALGPGSSPMDKTFSIPSQTGDLKLEVDFEYRFPMVWKVEGALFAEAGNIWKMSQGVKIADIAADYGLGLRLNLDFFLLRVDMGVRLRDPSLEGSKWIDPVTAFKTGGVALHFGVGYPF